MRVSVAHSLSLWETAGVRAEPGSTVKTVLAKPPGTPSPVLARCSVLRPASPSGRGVSPLPLGEGWGEGWPRALPARASRARGRSRLRPYRQRGPPRRAPPHGKRVTLGAHRASVKRGNTMATVAEKRTAFKELISKPGGHTAPGTYDVISALLVERAGFDLVHVSGSGTHRSAGCPDMGMLTLTEQVARATLIADAVSLPVLSDCE